MEISKFNEEHLFNMLLYIIFLMQLNEYIIRLYSMNQARI